MRKGEKRMTAIDDGITRSIDIWSRLNTKKLVSFLEIDMFKIGKQYWNSNEKRDWTIMCEVIEPISMCIWGNRERMHKKRKIK